MINASRPKTKSIPVGKVVGVLRGARVRPLPGAPDYIGGMALHNGRWIPVLCIDGRTAPTSQHSVIIVEDNLVGDGQSLFGVIIDRMEEAGADSPHASHQQSPADFPYRHVVAEPSPTTPAGKALAS